MIDTNKNHFHTNRRRSTSLTLNRQLRCRTPRRQLKSSRLQEENSKRMPDEYLDYITKSSRDTRTQRHLELKESRRDRRTRMKLEAQREMARRQERRQAEEERRRAAEERRRAVEARLRAEEDWQRARAERLMEMKEREASFDERQNAQDERLQMAEYEQDRSDAWDESDSKFWVDGRLQEDQRRYDEMLRESMMGVSTGLSEAMEIDEEDDEPQEVDDVANGDEEGEDAETWGDDEDYV